MTDFKPRTTIYKGIKMRSRLEAGFAQWLDGCGVRWEYEPSAFGGPTGQYLPDFLVFDFPTLSWLEVSAAPRIYVEVKPSNFTDIEAVRRQMLVIRESEPHALLLLVQQGHLPRIATPEGWVGATWVWDAAKDDPTGEKVLLALLPEEVTPWPSRFWQVR